MMHTVISYYIYYEQYSVDLDFLCPLIRGSPYEHMVTSSGTDVNSFRRCW